MLSAHLDLAAARHRPYRHQITGVQKIIDTPGMILADEMGLGKTKEVIDAAQVLFEICIVDRVLVVTPASVRGVWFDQTLGELAKHLWTTQSGRVIEFHAKLRGWNYGPEASRKLQWLITNYEFIRSKERLVQLFGFCGSTTMLVLDESSSVKNHRAQQTKSAGALRKRCGRVILLNGTPISHSPADLYSQAAIIDPKILGCASYFHFRARYAVMGGYMQKQIIGWQNLPDLQQRMAPYILRRLKSECIDLPPKLPSQIVTPALTPPTWHIYKEMRDELVAWLDKDITATASQAFVKTLRLAQITSGFVGGLQDQSHLHLHDEDEDRPGWVPQGIGTPNPGLTSNESLGQGPGVPALPDQDPPAVREVGREKLDAFLEHLDRLLEEDPAIKLLVWCRFRPELARAYEEVRRHRAFITTSNVGRIWGGQKREEREHALQLLDLRTMPRGPAVVFGTPHSGAHGHNLVGAHTVIYLSNDYSLGTRLQSEDRVYRIGQAHPVSYFDYVATGPQGQKTIDHRIIKALRDREDLATWTMSAWITALTEE